MIWKLIPDFDFRRDGVHDAGAAGVRGGEERGAASDAERHRDVAGRVRHVLRRGDQRADDHVHVRRDERDAAAGQLRDPEQRREHLLPGDGGGAGGRARERGAERDRQLPAAEPPRADRRPQFQAGGGA